MRSSLFWKLFVSHLAVVLLTAVCVSLFATAGTNEQALDTTRRFLRSKLGPIEVIARPVLAGTTEPGPLQAVIDRLGDDVDTRYTVIAADGRVLADSDEDPRNMRNHGSRPEVLEARRDVEGTSTRFSNTVGKELVYAARRVDAGDTLLGYVRVAIPVVNVDRDRAALREAILAAALLATGLGFLGCLLLADRFVRPLRALTRAAASLAAGNYDQRVPLDRSDQIGDLARAFDTMAGNLKLRIETITSERRELEAILSSMEEGVVAVDDAFRIVVMNDAAGRILGVRPEAAQGASAWEAVPLRPVTELIAKSLSDPPPEDVEIRIPGPPAERVLQAHAARIEAGEGAPPGVVVVLHDVTALRRLERVRRDFVANASHELKTPIAAIRGLLETIQDDPEMEEDTKRAFLERAHRQTGRVSELIEEMLALSRLEERADSKEADRLDLRVAVEEATETMRPLAAERGVTIGHDLPPEPVHVVGPGEGLQRIVGNLLDNAVKFTARNSTVTIRLNADTAEAVLEIQDAGPGIPTGEQDRIFERFYRVDRGRSRDVGGTGLGLAIVRHLVMGLGGDVEVEGGPGGGSLFRVRLPRAPTPLTPASSGPRA